MHVQQKCAVKLDALQIQIQIAGALFEIAVIGLAGLVVSALHDRILR